MKTNHFCAAFLAVMLLAAGGASQAWGASYKAIDLNPSGFSHSVAQGISGTQQVGCGGATGGNEHALLWSSSAASYVDLNPSGFEWSEAFGISGTQQVGRGDSHALLWSGTAASYVDLNPSGFTYSYAYGTNGTQQVGYGNGSATGGNYHALLWSETAASYVDLHQFLPTGFANSYAHGIDSYGNIVGSAADSSGNGHAILWEPIPEPATFLLLGLGGLAVMRKRRLVN